MNDISNVNTNNSRTLTIKISTLRIDEASTAQNYGSMATALTVS